MPSVHRIRRHLRGAGGEGETGKWGGRSGRGGGSGSERTSPAGKVRRDPGDPRAVQGRIQTIFFPRLFPVALSQIADIKFIQFMYFSE